MSHGSAAAPAPQPGTQVDPGCSACPLCVQHGTLSGSRERLRVPCHVRAFRHDAFTIWRCSGCGSLHSAEAVDLAPYYAAYPLRRHTLDLPARLSCRNRRLWLERCGLIRTCSVLDFGCGAGVFVEYLRGQGYGDVSGYDAYVETYGDRGVLSRRYDAVTCFDVIEHVQSPALLLETLSGLVRPGGLLGISTPDAGSISLAPDRPPAVDLSQPYHRHILSEPVLLNLASQRGFALVAIHRRYAADSWVPGVNTRFAWSYVQANEGLLDALTEPLRFSAFLRTPRLLWDALFGKLFPQRGNLFAIFEKVAGDRA